MKKNVFALIIYAFLLGMLCIRALSCNGEKKMKSSPLTKVVVDSVKVSKVTALKGEAELVVYGVLPNPAYSIDHFEVKIKDDKVQIVPWATHDPQKVVIMMTVPFAEKCQVTGLQHNQVYHVLVEGSQKTASARLSIK
jgi:hypothetical protein